MSWEWSVTRIKINYTKYNVSTNISIIQNYFLIKICVVGRTKTGDCLDSPALNLHLYDSPITEISANRWFSTNQSHFRSSRIESRLSVIIKRRSRCGSGPVLRHMPSSLHLQQFVVRFTQSNQTAVRIAQLPGGELHIHVHRGVDVHVPEAPFRSVVHHRRICILYKIFYSVNV